VLSYLTFTLACLGLLNAAVGAGALIILSMLVRRELSTCAVLFAQSVRSLRHVSFGQQRVATGVSAIAALLLLISVSIALLPPFSYDALWYHLAAPQALLQQHRLVALPALPLANMPIAIEMLYAICLMFDVQTGPALVHLTCAVLLTLATWSFARRLLGPRVAWFSVAALITSSDLLHWAPLPNIDLGLACYVFLALYSVVVWLTDRDHCWLLLAGGATGMALASKYTAAIYLVILVMTMLAATCRSRRDLLAGLHAAVLLTGIAVGVASPWYLKNLILLHDPVYPLLAAEYVDPSLVSQPAVTPPTPTTARHWQAALLIPWRLLQSENDMSVAGRSWQDYLALPLRLYSRGDLETYGRPGFLFLLAPLALCTRANWRRTWHLALFAALALGAWAVGGQELRYLLPLFPILALLAGCALAACAGNAERPSPGVALTAVAVVAVLMIALAEALLVAAVYNPLPVLSGQESKDAFLRRQVNVYGAYAYLQSVLPAGQRVLALGDSRGYYVHLPVLLDSSYDLERRVFLDPGSLARTAALLQRAGIGYVLVDQTDLTWRQQFAPLEAQREAAAFARFGREDLTVVYDAANVQVYRFVPSKEQR